MNYLLDTNVCIGYLNGRNPAVRNRILRVSPPQIFVCAVVKAELFAGALKSQFPVRTLERQSKFLGLFSSLPFDDAAAEHYGRIRSYLEVRGEPIGPYDLQIASIAITHGLILVTGNSREFSRIPSLSVENWETDDDTTSA